VSQCGQNLIHPASYVAPTPFYYLIELHRNAQELALCPREWMPWNYRETLERAVNLPDFAQSYDECHMAGKHSLCPLRESGIQEYPKGY
jgi:hypothetical protein